MGDRLVIARNPHNVIGCLEPEAVAAKAEGCRVEGTSENPELPNRKEAPLEAFNS